MTNLSLAGIHEPDQSAAPLWGNTPGTVVFTEAIGSNPNNRSGGDYRWWSERGFRVIVRLNNGYSPDGTIPAPSLYESFAGRCAGFVAASQGCNCWIIGNEPNHAQERPQGQEIRPVDYAWCFVLCRQAIKRVNNNHQVIVAGPAPWNQQSGDWLTYWCTVLKALIDMDGADCADGFAIHAYTHGSDPALIRDVTRVNGWLWHFRTYWDQLGLVPGALKHLPVDITETDQGDDAWVDANTGWVQAAVREINEWNSTPGTQKIRSVCLYRWPRYDTKYSFADKAGVLDDFREAVKLGLNAPEAEAAQAQPTPMETFMPSISTGEDNTAVLPPRVWDVRLDDRGVTIETPAVAPGQQFWRVMAARWYNEQEADAIGPDRHILAEVLDSAGKRVGPGLSLLVEWPSGHTLIYTEAKPQDPWAANYGMSKSLHEYSISVNDALVPSEKVVGIGMGADGNSGIHTSTFVTFQLVTMPAAQAPAAAQPTPQPTQPATVPILVHPIDDPALRIVSQVFGVNPKRYERFGLAGHNGIDFAVPVGTPILSVDRGTVAEALIDAEGYGLYVKLIHAWGESLYAHLSSLGFDIKPGSVVPAGYDLGKSGNSGNSSGPHLHFGIRVNPYQRGAPFDGYSDPAPYLQRTAQTGPFLPSQPSPEPVSHEPVRESYLKWFRQYSEQYGVEWHLLAALAFYETKFEVNAVSHKGAQGLMQFVPMTWADMQAQIGVTNPFDPEQSIQAAAFYLAQIRTYLIRYKKSTTEWVLAGYNFGMGAVSQATWEEVPAETRKYVDNILHLSVALKRWEEEW